jgi:hypothetical protein
LSHVFLLNITAAMRASHAICWCQDLPLAVVINVLIDSRVVNKAIKAIFRRREEVR